MAELITQQDEWMAIDDLIHQFALFVARVSDNPRTTEFERDALLVALEHLDEIATSAQ